MFKASQHIFSNASFHIVSTRISNYFHSCALLVPIFNKNESFIWWYCCWSFQCILSEQIWRIFFRKKKSSILCYHITYFIQSSISTIYIFMFKIITIIIKKENHFLLRLKEDEIFFHLVWYGLIWYMWCTSVNKDDNVDKISVGQ